MTQTEGSSTWTLVSRWSIRLLAVVEAIDALIFMRDGDPHPEFVLVLLTALGIIGAVLVWLSTRLPGQEWVWLGAGALLVAAAPAIFYPASGALFIVGVVVLALGAANAKSSRRAATVS